MIRILCVLAGAAGMVLFILPVFTGRIVNIGNVTGLAVSACLLLCGALGDQARALVRRGWESGPAARAALSAAGLLAAAVFVTAAALTVMMILAARGTPSADAPVVVLGCEVKGERPSRMLSLRIGAAARWLREHPDAVCVVSGGTGEGERISEAACMYRELTAEGIDPDRILMEDRSASTEENLRFSMRVLEEAGLTDTEEIAIVTNEFHACRARLIARGLGLRSGAVPAPSPWWLLPTFYVRELYGLLYQIFLSNP